MVRGINIVDARTSPCAIEYDANAVGLNLVETKDALSFGSLSHTAASSSHPYLFLPFGTTLVHQPHYAGGRCADVDHLQDARS